MNKNILRAIESGRAVLFLGAGVSLDSTDREGLKLPSGWDLAEELKTLVGLNSASSDLKKIYSYAVRNAPVTVEEYLGRRFSNTKPCEIIRKLIQYPWRKIYTINIDDTIEQACTIKNRNFRVFLRTDRVSEPDPGFDEIQIIKLNGCSRRISDGIIFSEKEYTKELVRKSPWYTKLGSDFHEEVFIFIGTKLEEPIFKYHVESYSCLYGGAPKAYLITPKIDELDLIEFEENNIVHCTGKLSDFVDFIDNEYPSGVDFQKVAKSRNPSLASFGKDPLSEVVTTVSRGGLLLSQTPAKAGKIRDFYKGFKISWRDVLDHIYADINCVTDFYKEILAIDSEVVSAILLKGNAGSGKTTALRAAAVALSDSGFPVYYIESSNIDSIKDMIFKMEVACIEKQVYFVFIDRLDNMTSEFSDLINSSLIKRGVLISAIQERHIKRLTIHNKESVLIEESKNISRMDACKILAKLEAYGPFHILRNMAKKVRVDTLTRKSSRQLLIGMLEATTGEGYKNIINKEFCSLDEDGKAFVQIIGLATTHRIGLSITLAERALNEINIEVSLKDLLTSTEGITSLLDGRLTLRHQTYADELQNMSKASDLRTYLYSLVNSFSLEKTPVALNQSKYNYSLFKRLLNYKFVLRLLKNDKKEIVDFFSSFEKPLESDGMYWLHYGLSLRKLGDHGLAYEMLKTAYEVYDKGHQTRHAFAQQELILSHKSESEVESRNLLESALSKIPADEMLPDRNGDYDLVLRSEFHVAIAYRLDGLEEAKKIANNYISLLQKRSKSNFRAKESFKKITAFITTGKSYPLNYEFDLQ